MIELERVFWQGGGREEGMKTVENLGIEFSLQGKSKSFVKKQTSNS
jgi:hypothetical protein